ncbi:hypothetical protein IAU60_004804 [Kwoniella sp. DSM 27419]
MPPCPVCEQDILADEAAFTHHVNSHFDSFQHQAAEPVESTEPKSTSCPVCDFPLSYLTPADFEAHMSACLDGEQHRLLRRSSTSQPLDHEVDDDVELDYDFTVNGPSSLQRRMDDQEIAAGWDGPAKPGGWMDWASKKVDKGDKWWDPISGSREDIPSNFSPGVIPVLDRCLKEGAHQGITRRAILCRDVSHIKGVWKFDMGWGCGYRNALMCLTSLLSVSDYAALFDRSVNGSDPGVRRIQGWIQEAWDEGFDAEGRQQLKGKILGSRKWIGPSDLYAMFTYKGIPCELYDFPKPVDSKHGSHTAHLVLQQWVKDYFSSDQASTSAVGTEVQSAFDLLMRTADHGAGRGEVVRISRKFPLVLQHSGHSRTIIGYEENARGDINLLLLDPGRSIPKDIRETSIERWSAERRAPLPPHRSSSSSSKIQPAQAAATTGGTPRKPSLPTILQKRSSRSFNETHESMPFSAPYTNGHSEILSPELVEDDIRRPSIDTNSARAQETTVHPAHQRGGTASGFGQGPQLEDDEEMTPGGWVRKKLSRDKTRRSSNGPQANMGGGVESLDTVRTLNYFRINLGSLSRHTEYQVLAFTGGPVLTMEERRARKVITSTVLRS